MALPYVVKRGDTLSHIAMENDMSLKELLRLNPSISNPNEIDVGDNIILTDNQATPTNTDDSYVIKPGDSLGKIAKKKNISVSQLKMANPNITPPDFTLHSNESLTLPQMSPINKVREILKNTDSTEICAEQKCPIKVLQINLQTRFQLCEPAMFKVIQYKGSPSESKKKNITWMVRDKLTLEDLLMGNEDIITQDGEKLIIDCVPFDWINRKVEVAAQFDETPRKKQQELTPYAASVYEWIALIKKTEKEHPDWSGVKMADAMRRLAGYDSSNFRKMHGGLSRAEKIKPSAGLTQMDIKSLERWTKHSDEKSGLVTDNNGDVIAAGHVLTGITGGMHRIENVNVTEYLFAVGETMDNLYALTISGDLGQVAVLVNEEKQKIPYIGKGTDASIPEIIGDIDGFNIGFGISKGGNKKLSDLLLSYYCSCETVNNFHDRTKLFEKNDNGKLQEQVIRFASTYIYSASGAGKTGGIFTEITTESKAATNEFWIWAKKQKEIEEKRIEQLKKDRRSMN